MENEFKYSKSYLPHASVLSKDQRFTSPNSKVCFKNTMFQFRSGHTPKKNVKNQHFLLEDNCGSETQTLATAKHLNFQIKDRCKTTKGEKKIMIPSLCQQNSDQKQFRVPSGPSEYSSSQNIEVHHDYIKLFQEDLLSNDRSIPQQVTFRSQYRMMNDKSQDRTPVKSKSPISTDLKKKVSIQFTSPKSPKYTFTKQQNYNKLQKTVSTFDFNPKMTSDLKELKQQIKQLKAQKQKEEQLITNDRLIHRELKDSFLLQISNLREVVDKLQSKLAQKQQELVSKSTKFNKQIDQLKNHCQNLSTKLQNTIIPSEFNGNQKDIVLNELQQRLNSKDLNIIQLQTLNHNLSSKVDTLQFQIQTLKAKQVKLNSSNIASELSVFEQALKYSIQQVTRYKQRIQAKQQQIKQIKQTYGITKGQTERTKNQLSIQQLKRITQVQTLKTTHQAQNNFKSNQIRDLKHQVSLLQNKVRCLTKQVQQKDTFIMSKIKINEK